MGSAIILLPLVIIALAIYFIPAYIADKRKTHNASGIFLLNFLLGWTVVGWAIALVMACGSMKKIYVEGDTDYEVEEVIDYDDSVASDPVEIMEDKKEESSHEKRLTALERLFKLKVDGVLSEDEFEAEKKRILSPL